MNKNHWIASQDRNLITTESIFSASLKKEELNTTPYPKHHVPRESTEFLGSSLSCPGHHCIYLQSTPALKDVKCISVSDTVTLHAWASSWRASFGRRKLITHEG